MTMTPEQAAWFQGTFARLVDNVDQALMGKREVVALVLSAMLAEGHVLLEDAPGTGKTSLAKALAATVQGTSSRIQFTPDLLPSDVTGVTIYDQASHRFEFHRGPVFASIVLADEINRASPKTQSALLEVMEESRITVDGVTHDVGRPFLVIATQNPIEQAGTYKLPEAQLDRFLIRTTIGYPDLDAEERILAGAADRNPSAHLPAIITTSAVADMADLAASVHVESAVLRYTAELAKATRTHTHNEVK
jgi:MoxR-like ATPase